MQGGRCPECGLTPEGPGHFALIDDGTPAEGFPDDPGECCEPLRAPAVVRDTACLRSRRGRGP